MVEYIVNIYSQDETCILTVLMETFDDQKFISLFILIGDGCLEPPFTKDVETLSWLSRKEHHDLLEMSDNHRSL